MSKIDLEALVCLKRARTDIERGNCEYNVTDYLDTIEAALLELKSIKEANPSEALELVDKMANYILLDEEYGFIDEKEKQAIIKDRDTIKQALLKAQEPKHYLKWEDLEFKIETQEMFVLLNGNLYFVEYYTDGEAEVVMVKTTYTTVFVLDSYCIDDKQFFNDLHLERVEE